MIKNSSLSGLLNILNPFERPYLNKYAAMEDYTFEYFPVRDIFIWFQYWIFGENPLGFHAFSVGIHVLNTLFVYWSILKLTGLELTALGVGAIFAVHPVNVEAVSWISAQKDILSTMFFLICFLSFMYNYYFLSFILFVFSLLSKPSIAFAIIPMGLYMALFFKDKRLGSYVYKFLPLIVLILAFFGLLRSHLLKDLSMFEIFPLKLISFLQGLVSIRISIGNIFFPFHLKVIHNIPYNAQSLIVSFIVCVCLILTIILTINKASIVSFGLLWFVTTLLPLFFIYKGMAMSDKYLYLPSVGFLLSIIWPLSRRDFKGKTHIFFVVLLCLSILSVKREYIWKDSLTLWLQALEETPESWLVHHKLGTIFTEEGKMGMAIQEYEKATSIFPTALPSLRNLGAIMVREKRYDKAIEIFEKAVKAHPEYPEIHRFLGVLYLKITHDKNEAIYHLRRSLELDPHQDGADVLRKAIKGYTPD